MGSEETPQTPTKSTFYITKQSKGQHSVQERKGVLSYAEEGSCNILCLVYMARLRGNGGCRSDFCEKTAGPAHMLN